MSNSPTNSSRSLYISNPFLLRFTFASSISYSPKPDEGMGGAPVMAPEGCEPPVRTCHDRQVSRFVVPQIGQTRSAAKRLASQRRDARRSALHRGGFWTRPRFAPLGAVLPGFVP